MSSQDSKRDKYGLNKDLLITSWVSSEWFNVTAVSCYIYGILCNVVSIISADPELCIRLVVSRNSRIQFMIYQ